MTSQTTTSTCCPTEPGFSVREPGFSVRGAGFLRTGAGFLRQGAGFLRQGAGCLRTGSRVSPYGSRVSPYGELPLPGHTPKSICKTALPQRTNEPQTTRFYSQTCSATTPQLPPNHQILFAKLLSHHAPRPPHHENLFAKLLSHHASTTSQPRESIRKTALPQRLNDPQTTRFYSQNCSPTAPQ